MPINRFLDQELGDSLNSPEFKEQLENIFSKVGHDCLEVLNFSENGFGPSGLVNLVRDHFQEKWEFFSRGTEGTLFIVHFAELSSISMLSVDIVLEDSENMDGISLFIPRKRGEEFLRLFTVSLND